ncbi:MAG: hypothetical protein NUV57_02660, partial [archaeon]|nr:hypothetical protein [archaeon]
MKTLLILVGLVFLLGCTTYEFDGQTNALTVAELLESPEIYLNNNVIVTGNLGLQACTKMACTEENICCNSCFAELSDSDNSSLTINITGKDCAFNAIREENGFAFLEGTFIQTEKGYSIILKDIETPPVPGEWQWFSINPVQCNGNEWDKWHDSLGRQYIRAPTDEEILKEWLSTVHGIEIDGYASKQVYDVVCEACSCPRGDKVAVRVGLYDYAKIKAIGFEPMGNIGCTEEAKLCPDGSAVGREGPFCEFASCSNSGNLTEFDFDKEFIITEDKIYQPKDEENQGMITIAGVSFEDSRCPVDQNILCFWAGEEGVRLSIRSP